MSDMTHNFEDDDFKAPIIAGVEIATDKFGRFNLNALHKASEEGEHKRPSKWLATEQAKGLISELEAQSPNSGFGVIKAVKGGNAPGTFAAEELAVAYAAWISPPFHLEVNRTFIAFRKGGAPKPINLPAEVLDQIERTNGIARMLSRKITEMEKALPLIASEMADRLVTARLAESAMLIRSGKTAKQIWDAAGLPPKIKGATVWFGNRLKEGGCLLEGRADRGSAAIRLFDPDKAETLLRLGLLHKSKVYASERMGQGKFKLIGGGQ